MTAVEAAREEAFERDRPVATARELWLYARFNLLRLCGVGPMPYLKPRSLIEVAFVFCDTDKGRYVGQRHWMPVREVCDVL